MRGNDPHASSELHELALQKTAAVLGRERAEQLIERLLQQHGLELHTAEDLLALSEAMTALGGFEGAVGAMLGVVAIMRGSSAKRCQAESPHELPTNRLRD